MCSSPFVCILGHDSNDARSRVTWFGGCFFFEMMFSVSCVLVILKFAMMSMFEQGYSGNFKLK